MEPNPAYINVHWENTNLLKNDSFIPKSFVCMWPDCGRTFAFNDVFKLHLNLHIDDIDKCGTGSESNFEIKEEIDDNQSHVDSEQNDSIDVNYDPLQSTEVKTESVDEYGEYEILEPHFVENLDKPSVAESDNNYGFNSDCNTTNRQNLKKVINDNLKKLFNVNLTKQFNKYSNITEKKSNPEKNVNAVKLGSDREDIHDQAVTNSQATPKYIGSQLVLCDWEDCTKTYKTVQTMKAHYKNHHSTNNKLRSIRGRKPQTCLCSNCVDKNHKSNVRRQHICDYVGNVERGSCAHKCGKLFASPYQLIRHARVHSRQRPLVCGFEKCKKSFSRALALSFQSRLSNSLFD